MLFYEELKRRNVVKTLVLYVVASWITLQVADVLFEAMELPTSWLRLVLALLILGLPLALIFSWVFELTPDGLKREKDVERSNSVAPETSRKIDILIIILLAIAITSVAMGQLIGRVEPYLLVVALLLVVVAVVAAARYVVAGNKLPAVSDDSRSATEKSGDSVAEFDNTIAVMPFLNLSSESEQEYFSDGLAAVYCDQTDRGRRRSNEGYELARGVINKALLIDPDFAKGHSRLGIIAIHFDNDLKSAARHIERALELDPKDLEILGDAATLALSLGMLEKAIKIQKFVLTHDPVNASAHRRIGVSYLFNEQLDDALSSLQTSLTLSPGMLGSHQMKGIALLLKNEPLLALEEMEQDEDSWRQIGLVMAHHALGHFQASDAALVKAIEVSEETAAYNIAFVLAFRNEADRAFEWLEKAVNYKDSGLSQIAIMPLFANIYDDQWWLPFLESRGRSPQQLASIEFALQFTE